MKMSKHFDPTLLSHFTGTENYWRINPRTVLTDGTKYLADAAGAYWLMDAIASYLPQFTGKEDFIVAKLVRAGIAAQLTLDDGNGRVLDQQHIPFTDFPMTSIQLYACWGGEFWVLMLCSEY
jgi:hypothetical protein